MSEEYQGSPSQSIIGKYNAQNIGSGSATVNVYENIVPCPVDPSVIAAALQRLNSLPLDHLPTLSLLPPASRLPAFARNNSFVGREVELARVAVTLQAHNLATVAVTGLGGIGKSQLASEFVYRYGQYFAGGVFWLSFASADTVLAEVAMCTTALGQELRLDVRTMPVEEQVLLVLSSWQNKLPRLLIFDNCEDEALLAYWRPRTGGCRILLTSRREVWHPDLAVHQVALDVFPRAKSVELLRVYRPDLSVIDGEKIAEELGDLPLALSVAGSYLNEYQGSRLGIPNNYLLALRRMTPLQHSSLQQEGSNYITRHRKHVAQTFALSYERLDPSEIIDATALQVLARVACFAPGEPIPRELLRITMGPEEDDDLEDRFVKALKRLHALGLLTTQQEGGQQMHRLLVAFVQERLASAAIATEAQAAVEQAISRRMWNVNNIGYPAPLLGLQKHLRVVVTRAQERGDTVAADLSDALGRHLGEIGAYQEAQGYREHALSIWEQSLGLEHPNVAYTLNNLAEAYREQGKYEQAESLYQRALRTWEQSLGLEHPDVAYTFTNLAILYAQQGKYEQAESLYERALSIRERSLDPEHPKVSHTLNGLANLYLRQGKYEQAESLYERALSIRERSLGPEHPDLAYTLTNLASLYAQQGKYEQAESLYERALSIRERSLGPKHSKMAFSLNGLADLYLRQGKYEQAESLYERALSIWEQSLGLEHPDVAYALNNLAEAYREQGKYEQAESLYQRALSIWEQSLGSEHSHTQQVRKNYALLLYAMKRDVEVREVEGKE